MKKILTTFIFTAIASLNFFYFSAPVSAASCCVCVEQDTEAQGGFNYNWNEGQVFPDITNDLNSVCSVDKKNEIMLKQITPFICAIKDITKCTPPAPATTKLEEEFKLQNVVLGITIPGLTFSPPPAQVDANGNIYIPWLAEYIKALYNFAVVIISIIAVVVVILQGAKIITSAGGPAKGEAYKRITQAVIGLFIAWGSYIILYSINPGLTAFKPLGVKYVTTKDIAGIEEAGPSISKEEILAIIDQVSQSSGVDKCILETIVAKESGYKSNRIGHDEDVPRAQVGSRVKFIKSGEKYSGVTFSTAPAGYANKQIQNDDGYKPSEPPNYGLDPRFTHGGGLGQFTVLIDKKTGEMTRCSDGNVGRTIGGACYNFPQLMEPKTAVELSAKLINTIGTGSPEKLFYRYAGKGCSARVSQCRKMKAYADCKKDPTLAKNEVPGDCLVWLKESFANCANPGYRNPTSQPTPNDKELEKEAEQMVDEEVGQSNQNY